MFYVPSNLRKGDVVDLRISFPNGEDYIVISKKSIKDLYIKQNTLWLWLNEIEIHRVQSAIIDAYLNSGTRLYVLKYVQPEMQEKAIPTYIVNQNVMDVMKDSPNIIQLAEQELAIEARNNLEKRLDIIEEKNMSMLESEINREQSIRNTISSLRKEESDTNDEQQSIKKESDMVEEYN